MSACARFARCGRVAPLRRSKSTGTVKLGGGGAVKEGARAGDEGMRAGMEGAPSLRWHKPAASGSLARLYACRTPGLRVQHMHNPPVAEILQPFSPKEVG
jgi:hypothetical protein